ICLAVLFAACDGSARPPGAAKPAEAPAASVPEQVVALFEGRTARLAGAQGRSDEVTRHVSECVDAKRAVYPRLDQDERATELTDAERARYKDRLREALGSVTDAGLACREHLAATAAFQGFDALVDPR